MRDHDVENEHTVDAAHRRDDDQGHDATSARDVGHGIAAGRPDALGPAGLLHLQTLAGNQGVNALVAQRARSDEEERSPVGDVVAGAGRPLEPELRSSMETKLGHDFSSVRVHDDGPAAASAKSVQAHAYTVGEHVVFGEGRYQPESSDGRRTLAHELTHVVQQRRGPVDGTPAPGGIQISHPDDPFEREAESVADRVMSAPEPEAAPSADPAPAPETAPAPTEAPVQRQAAEEEEEAPAPEGPAAEAPAQEEAPAEAPAAEAPAEEKEPEEEESVTGD
jgi:hypothetical protein